MSPVCWRCASSQSTPAHFQGASRSPIERALDYLLAQQVAESFDTTLNGVRVIDREGNWPQYFHLKGNEAFRFRDVSPFTVSFIHHALSHVVSENRRALALGGRDLILARLMRQRAVTFLRSFESKPDGADAGTFGFWPYDTDPATPTPFVNALLTWWLKGPILAAIECRSIFRSTRALSPSLPMRMSPRQSTLRSWTTRLPTEDLAATPQFERFFVDWRDVGVVPRRLNPFWLPTASGVFLTWLTYRDAPTPVFPNDVDLVVNANVLYSLGRYGRLDVPGAAEAVWFINRVVELGIHRDHFQEISEYYPDNFAFHYVVSRAFREGPVPALEPAVEILASDLEASALARPDGSVYWDRGAPQLNTAFAVLTLLNAGRSTPLLDRAIQYLMKEQGAFGGFASATFFFGRTDGGQVFEFTSPSFTTAMALEAFVRYEVAKCQQSPRPSRC